MEFTKSSKTRDRNVPLIKSPTGVKNSCEICYRCCRNGVLCSVCNLNFHTQCDRNSDVSDVSAEDGFTCSSCSFDYGSVLKKMNQASKKGIRQLISTVNSSVVSLPNIRLPDSPSSHLNSVNPDPIATHLLSRYGGNATETALHVTSNGNCLFNAVSLAVFGHEAKATELRVRTCIELVLNKPFYLQRNGNKEVRLVSPSYDQAIRDCARDFTSSSLWTMHALASVVRSEIISCYPGVNGFKDQCNKILNHTFTPRHLDSNKDPISVTWTSTSWPRPEKTWTPNHFSLLVNRVKIQPILIVDDTPDNHVKSESTKTRSWADVLTGQNKTKPSTKRKKKIPSSKGSSKKAKGESSNSRLESEKLQHEHLGNQTMEHSYGTESTDTSPTPQSFLPPPVPECYPFSFMEASTSFTINGADDLERDVPDSSLNEFGSEKESFHAGNKMQSTPLPNIQASTSFTINGADDLERDVPDSSLNEFGSEKESFHAGNKMQSTPLPNIQASTSFTINGADDLERDVPDSSLNEFGSEKESFHAGNKMQSTPLPNIQPGVSNSETTSCGSPNNGSFKGSQEVFDVMVGARDAIDQIPLGLKENVSFTINNEQNRTRTIKKCYRRFPDDCGVWADTSSKKHSFIYNQGSLTTVVKRNQLYCKQVRKEYVPLEPQPSEEEICIMTFYYAKLKRDKSFKKRITWIEKCPPSIPSSRMNTAVVEYCGKFPASTSVHGNSKTHEGEFVRTDTKVRERIKQKVLHKAPKEVYKDFLLNDSTCAPRDLKQVYNIKQAEVKAKMPGNRGNNADDLQTLISSINDSAFLQEVTASKGKPPVVILYTQEQIRDLRTFCGVTRDRPPKETKIRSKDNLLEIPKTSQTAKKPGQRKRVRTSKTTSLK